MRLTLRPRQWKWMLPEPGELTLEIRDAAWGSSRARSRQAFFSTKPAGSGISLF
jgi:hypothetical protein